MLSAVRKRERGPRDYLFQPPGSNIWWIKLQRPGKRIERSLRTTNRIEAEINAAPLIQEHREWLLSRPRPLALVESWQRELEPGLHTLADGSTVFATERELHVVGSDGAVIARISHRIRRIEAPNQRKLFCENDFLMIRGEPRCRQSVSRIFLDLKPSKAALWSRRLRWCDHIGCGRAAVGRDGSGDPDDGSAGVD